MVARGVSKAQVGHKTKAWDLSSCFCPRKKKNLKENALDIHFSHWTTDQQLEKSELKPKSNENVTVPICCSTLDA